MNRTRPGPGLMLRVADGSDIGTVVALVESAYRGESSRAGWTTEADLLDGQRTDHDAVAELIAGERSEILLAVCEGEILGCCELDAPSNTGATPVTGEESAGATATTTEDTPDGAAYFGMFAVRPGLQGAGIGRWLVDQAEQKALTCHKAKRLRMTVIAQRRELIAWYERLGYRLTGERLPFPYGNERFGIPRRGDLEFVVLEKIISPRRPATF